MSSVSDSARVSAVALLSTITTSAHVATKAVDSIGFAADVMHVRTKAWSRNAIKDSALADRNSSKRLAANAAMRDLQLKSEIETFIGDDDAKRSEFNEAYAEYEQILANLK